MPRGWRKAVLRFSEPAVHACSLMQSVGFHGGIAPSCAIIRVSCRCLAAPCVESVVPQQALRKPSSTQFERHEGAHRLRSRRNDECRVTAGDFTDTPSGFSPHSVGTTHDFVRLAQPRLNRQRVSTPIGLLSIGFHPELDAGGVRPRLAQRGAKRGCHVAAGNSMVGDLHPCQPCTNVKNTSASLQKWYSRTLARWRVHGETHNKSNVELGGDASHGRHSMRDHRVPCEACE